MVTNYKEVPINDLIAKTAELLKGIDGIESPEWAQFVKTGVHKERPPVDKDWWYMRAAAVLKSVEKLGPVGVSKLRVKYGGRKNRGMRPEQFRPGSGKILRTVLQQLEAAKLVRYQKEGIHKGRVITGDGVKVLAQAAGELVK